MQRKETRRLRCPLTDAEVASRAALLASESVERAKMERHLEEFQDSHKDAVKARKDLIKEKVGEVMALADQVATRSEMRHTDCEWRADLDGGWEFLIRFDTGQAVERRKLSDERRQLVIGERLEEATADQLKLWESQIGAPVENPWSDDTTEPDAGT